MYVQSHRVAYPLNFLNRIEQVLSQPVITDRTVVAFNIRVLLQFAGLDKFQPDPAFFGPLLKQFTNVFRTIVIAQ